MKHVILSLLMLLAPALTSAAEPGKDADQAYVLGPQDMIEVAVLGQPEYTTRTRIRTDGTLALPYVGVVAAQGKTALDFASNAEIKKAVSEAMAK